MYKVVVDAYGGDNAPLAIVQGSVMAVNKRQDLHITLVGKEDELTELLKQETYNKTQISLVNATEVITNNEAPVEAIRTKKDSTLNVSFEQLKQDEETVGFVSAGSTGAVLTGAFLKIGRMRGISRPALCPILPTVKGGIVGIIDVGANMDTKQLNLLHFAVMGSAYLKQAYGVENPRVALLNVGVEDKKGNELTKTTFSLLKQLPNINFVGNVEARELLSGNFDLVVCDGFAGNVLLKSAEGAISNLLKMLKSEIMSSAMSKIGAVFMKKSFKNLKSKVDYSQKGGAVFLGCKKVVVKSHGSSGAISIMESIFQVVEMAENQLQQGIETSLTQVDWDKMKEQIANGK